VSGPSENANSGKGRQENISGVIASEIIPDHSLPNDATDNSRDRHHPEGLWTATRKRASTQLLISSLWDSLEPHSSRFAPLVAP